jgi:hypothetical protein
MRRIVPAAVVAAIALVVFAIPASARIDHHFSVIEKNTIFHRDADGFHFREQLFAGFNPNDQVGNAHVQCRQSASRKLRCRAVAHLNGEEGGFGFIRVNGNIGHGDRRLNVTGGTDDFDGVAGKVIPHGHHLSFDLVR